jgi:hypothetical protein
VQSETSAIGVNSDNVISGGNWVGNVYTGAGEQNDYNYVGVNLQVDEAGTLTFEFSQDGTNWSQYPVTEFTVASGINEVHGAWKGTRYVRPRFTGVDGSRTFFRLRTMYSYAPVTLTAPLNQSISNDQDAAIVRSVGIGEDPTGTYTNQKVDGAAFVTTANLAGGATYDSGVIDIQNYNQVQSQLVSDKNGTIEFIFGSSAVMTGNTPGANGVERVVTVPYETTDGFQLYSAPAFTPYARYRFTNDEVSITTQLFFETKLLTKALSGQVLGVNSFIAPGMVANLGRNIIVGQTDGGQFLNVPVDEKGHLETSIHGPLLPFGSVHTEKLTPVFQTDAVYGINSGQVSTTSSLSGTATTNDSKFSVSTGTTSLAQASIQSRRRLRYRPGQGVIGRFTAKYTTPVPFSYQIAGYGHAEDGVYFGYKDIAGVTPEFGILYVNRGVREIQTLTITTGSSTAENVVVVLNNVGFDVPVTNSGNIQRTVWEISHFDYDGWTAYPDGATIVFVASSAGDKTGTFALTGTTAAGTFAETRTGADGTEEFIPQSTWNGDKLDGNGTSGVTLDPTKGNVFQINIQYLGFGAIDFKVEVVSGGNNPIWVTVHTLDNPNNLTTTSFANPSFPFTMAAYSAGSTTDLTVETGSFAGFVEGDIETRGNRFVYSNGLAATVTTAAFHCLGTILNKRVYNGSASQVVINIKEFAGHIEDSQSGGSLYLIRNGELQGNPNFQDYSSTSSTSWDTAATTVTFSDNNQVVADIPLGINGSEDNQIQDTITLQPGEWITLAARADTQTLDYCTIALTTREDQ